jgi:diaminohydroxyphosphoribosylaminopyrimidine deaminase/5-amino-6-(5-phosphoribosylamino)uracil reductase
LVAQGISVEGRLMEDEARSASLEPWLYTTQYGRPFVSLKYAATLDGKIAAEDGSSKWVTSEAARRDVQLWRSRCDAIVIGTNTALLDNPRLTLRDSDGELEDRQLLRVVVGMRKIPEGFNLYDDNAETIFIHEHDPEKVLDTLFERGVQHVYLEGGHTMAAAFLHSGLVNRVFIYIAPKFLGLGTPAVGDLGISSISNALELSIKDVTTIVDGQETDVRLIGYPVRRGP